MQSSANDVWKNDWVVRRFLEGVRGGIPYANDQLEVMLRLLDAAERPINTFLDLGSGSGLLAIAILTRHPEARATLVDFSEPMMEAARDLLGEDTNLPSFVLADLNSPNWAATVQDVASASPWLEDVWNEAMIDSLTEYHERQRTGQSREMIAREYGRRPDQEANVLATAETQLPWLRDAGFADVDCVFKYFELAVLAGRRPA